MTKKKAVALQIKGYFADLSNYYGIEENNSKFRVIYYRNY